MTTFLEAQKANNINPDKPASSDAYWSRFQLFDLAYMSQYLEQT